MIKPHKDFSKAQSHLNKNRLYLEIQSMIFSRGLITTLCIEL